MKTEIVLPTYVEIKLKIVHAQLLGNGLCNQVTSSFCATVLRQKVGLQAFSLSKVSQSYA